MSRLSKASVAAGICALAVAPAARAATVTIGTTDGTPNTNICVAGFACTYVPFADAATPVLVVPFDGTITGWSINSGSSANAITLRVLRPASGGRFTAVGGSAPAILTPTGIQSFTANIPVRDGDVLGIDNDSSALIFDGTVTSPITRYFQPALAAGQTGAPTTTRTGARLLLSATVRPTPAGGGGGGGGGSGGGEGGGTSTQDQCVVPRLRNLTLTGARKALAKSHCKLGRVTRRASRRVRRGRVISQQPGATWRREVGAKVAVAVSSGPPRRRG